MEDRFLNIGISIIGFLITYILYELNSSIKKATEKINELNEKMARFIQKGESNEKEIEKLDTRIIVLEGQMSTTKERLHTIGNMINTLDCKDKLTWVNNECNKNN